MPPDGSSFPSITGVSAGSHPAKVENDLEGEHGRTGGLGLDRSDAELSDGWK